MIGRQVTPPHTFFNATHVSILFDIIEMSCTATRTLVFLRSGPPRRGGRLLPMYYILLRRIILYTIVLFGYS